MALAPDSSFSDFPIRLDQVPGCACVNGPGLFIPEKTLSGLIHALQQGEETQTYPHQINFYQALFQWNVLLPLPVSMQTNTVLSLFLLEDDDRQKALSLFTHEEAMLAWLEQRPACYVVTTLAEVAQLALISRVDYLLVNVADIVSLQIPLSHCRYLAKGQLPPPPEQLVDVTTLSKNTPIQLALAEPLKPPVAERLQQFCQHMSALIDRLYIFNMATHSEPMHLTFGVRMPHTELEAWEPLLWPNLKAVLNEVLEEHAVFNVMLLNHVENIEPDLVNLTSPFFSIAKKL